MIALTCRMGFFPPQCGTELPMKVFRASSKSNCEFNDLPDPAVIRTRESYIMQSRARAGRQRASLMCTGWSITRWIYDVD